MLDSGSKKVILFGCGIIGHEVLERLSADNVLCFCDNNKSLHGTTKWGKDIFSLEYIKNNYNGVVILICARIDKAYKIICQLDENEVYSYWCYPFIKNYIQDYPKEKLLELFYNKELMVKNRMMFYKYKISELENQLDYMKRHADIKKMKPATGDLRQRQLDTAELGGFICNVFDDVLHIKPFLIAGGLIGYVRHNGFIPWDDDLDFGLIREEYEQLYQYCLMNQDKDGMVVFKYRDIIERLNFTARNNFFSLAKFFYSCSENEECRAVKVDFFSFDYYAGNYSFDEYKRDAERIKINTNSFISEEEKIEYVRSEIKKNKYVVEKSNSIFFGFDNMESTLVYNKGSMMSEEILFPLNKVRYEGKEIWIPNKPEEFLSYEYKDIWEFPDDVGMQNH